MSATEQSLRPFEQMPITRPKGQFGMTKFMPAPIRKEIRERRKALKQIETVTKQCTIKKKFLPIIAKLEDCYINKHGVGSGAEEWDYCQGTPSKCCGKFINEMERAGAKFVGEGMTRVVFSYGKGDRCILKVAKGFQDGTRGTREEVAIWNQVSTEMPEVKHLMIPIIDHDDTGDDMWVTTIKVDRVGEDMDHDEKEDIRREIKNELAKVGEYCIDLHGNNIGILKGRPVLIDFGFGFKQCPRSRGPITVPRDEDEEEEEEPEPSPEPEEEWPGSFTMQKLSILGKFRKRFPALRNADPHDIDVVSDDEIVWVDPNDGVQTFRLPKNTESKSAIKKSESGQVLTNYRVYAYEVENVGNELPFWVTKEGGKCGQHYDVSSLRSPKDLLIDLVSEPVSDWVSPLCKLQPGVYKFGLREERHPLKGAFFIAELVEGAASARLMDRLDIKKPIVETS